MSKTNVAFLIILILLSSTNVFGFRYARPFTFTYPLDEKQITELNKLLDDMWEVHKGRQNFDIVTTSKANADNGEFWLLNSGSTMYIQYKADDTVHTVTPDS